MNILISACLLGVNCRYSGDGKLVDGVEELMAKHHLIPVCPEILGGLATPRDPAERVGDKVMTNSGCDVTAAYKRGAEEVLHLARLYQCQYAILKERSPSCGRDVIYDGTFSKKQIEGNGVCAELLLKHGISIMGESEILDFLERGEMVDREDNGL